MFHFSRIASAGIINKAVASPLSSTIARPISTSRFFNGSKKLSKSISRSFKRYYNQNHDWENRFRSTYYTLAISTIVFAVGYECTVRRQQMVDDWTTFKKQLDPPLWDMPVNTIGELFYDEPNRFLFKTLTEKINTWISNYHHSSDNPLLVLLSGLPGAGKYTTAYDVLSVLYKQSLESSKQPPTFFMISCKRDSSIKDDLMALSSTLKLPIDKRLNDASLSSDVWDVQLKAISNQLEKRRGKLFVILKCIRNCDYLEQLYSFLPQNSNTIIIATAGLDMQDKIKGMDGIVVDKLFNVSNSAIIYDLKKELPGTKSYELRRLDALMGSEPRLLIQACSAIKQLDLTPLSYCHHIEQMMHDENISVPKAVILFSVRSIYNFFKDRPSFKKVTISPLKRNNSYSKGLSLHALASISDEVFQGDRHNNEHQVNDFVGALIVFGLAKFIDDKLYPRLLNEQLAYLQEMIGK